MSRKETRVPLNDFFEFLAFANLLGNVVIGSMIVAAVMLILYFIFD